MQKQFKREQRYFVVKVKDAKEYLDAHQLEKLAEIADTISEGREKDGIPAVDCVVVESDWPEYELTWKAIEARMTGAQPAPSVPEGFSREDLEAAADGLDGYEKTVNVGNVTGEGDAHLESTTAYAARFIRAMLAAAPEAKP